MKKLILASICCFPLFFGGCNDDIDDGEWVEPELYELIEITTDFGDMLIYLYPETPIHKNNFDSLTRAGFYDSTEFHRCVDDFVIQGGSPTSKDDNRNNDGVGGPGYTLPAEIDTTLFKHKFGSVAAARLGNMSNPERRSSGSQFYIVTDEERGASFLDNEYTVYGEVVLGMDVAKTIESQPKNSNGLPNERIKMFVNHKSFTKSQLNELGITLP